MTSIPTTLGCTALEVPLPQRGCLLAWEQTKHSSELQVTFLSGHFGPLLTRGQQDVKRVTILNGVNYSEQQEAAGLL